MNDNNDEIQLDIELLDGYVKGLGVNVVKQMFDLYRQQVTIYLKDIEGAMLSGNEQLWQDHCHKMKGAAGSVGLKSLHSRLKLMEKTTASISGKTHQLAELKNHNSQAMADFNDWVGHF